MFGVFGAFLDGQGKKLKVKLELILSEAIRVRGEVDKGTECALKCW